MTIQAPVPQIQARIRHPRPEARSHLPPHLHRLRPEAHPRPLRLSRQSLQVRSQALLSLIPRQGIKQSEKECNQLRNLRKLFI